MNYETLKEEFLTQTGYDLESQISNGSNEIGKGNRTLAKQHILLQSYIRKYNIRFDYESLTDARQQEYREILIEQVLYSLENDDLTTWNGVDASGNTIAENDIKSRLVSPFVKDLLYAKGFLSRAVL